MKVLSNSKQLLSQWVLFFNHRTIKFSTVSHSRKTWNVLELMLEIFVVLKYVVTLT